MLSTQFPGGKRFDACLLFGERLDLRDWLGKALDSMQVKTVCKIQHWRDKFLKPPQEFRAIDHHAIFKRHEPFVIRLNSKTEVPINTQSYL